MKAMKAMKAMKRQAVSATEIVVSSANGDGSQAMEAMKSMKREVVSATDTEVMVGSGGAGGLQEVLPFNDHSGAALAALQERHRLCTKWKPI